METVSTQAFVNGTAAAGAVQVKPGFAITPEDDLMFALGYPHVGFIIDGHADEEPSNDVDTWFARCFRTGHFCQGVYAVPRSIAFRQLRVAGCRVVDTAEGFSDEFRAAVLNEAAVTLEEATECLAGFLRANRPQLTTPVNLFECLFGPDALLGALVPLVETADPASIHDVRLNYFAYSLAPVLLRATTAAAANARERLMAVFATTPVELRSQRQSFGASLGQGIAGAAFARDFGLKTKSGVVQETSLEFAQDDPDFVRDQLRQLEQLPIQPYGDSFPRLVFIAGDEFIERNRRITAMQKDAESHRNAVETFGRMHSARATRMLLWLATKSKAKKEALAWLKQHEAKFAPFLEEIGAGSEEDAKLVEGVQKKLAKLRVAG